MSNPFPPLPTAPRAISITSEPVFIVQLGDQQARLTRQECVLLNERLNEMMAALVSAHLREVIELVAAEFHVSVAEILGTSRIEPVSRPRQAVMWLGRTVLGMSFCAVAREMQRDHGTIMHGTRAVQALIDTDPLWQHRMGRLKSVVEQRLQAAQQEVA